MKEKIAEMAKDLCDSTMCDLETFNNCRMPQGNCSRCQRVAKDLYNTGYRKQSEGEWISVEERIPKNFESVLVLATRLEDDEYDVLVAYHDRGDWEEQHTRRYESPICGEIKYWMPLPEPLKGE